MNRKRVVTIVMLMLVAAGAWLFMRPPPAEAGALAASGTVEATEADLGFLSGGRIAEVAVHEGDAVAAGNVLARLDVAELDARRAAAEAHLDGARAQLREMAQGARPEEREQSRAAADAARQRMEDASRVLDRSRRLFEGGALSREQMEQAETAYQTARAQFAQASEQLKLVRKGPREERLAAQRAAVKQAEAMLAQVEAAAQNSVIRAPFAGVVTIRHREPGETVAPGAPVLSLMDPSDRWVRIFVPENRIGRVSTGQAAEIHSDSHPETSYRGEVAQIANQAEFTPRNVQTAEERVKLVYAVKVRIAGDPKLHLKPGVPADVTLRASAR